MSGFSSKFMNFLKLTDDDEFEDDFYEDDMDYNDQKELEKEEKRLMKERKKSAKKNTVSAYEEDDYFNKETAATAPRQVSSVSTSRPQTRKVVQMPSSGNDMEVCIMKPANIDEAPSVCSLLLDNHPVVVNLEGVDTLEAQRIMDFICGCIFAIEGNMCQVSRYIFIFSPSGVDITGEALKNVKDGDYNVEIISKGF